MSKHSKFEPKQESSASTASCNSSLNSETLHAERKKYCRNKLLLSCIEELLSTDSTIDPELKKKIKKIMLEENMSQLRLADNQTVLGIPPMQTHNTLTDAEGRVVSDRLKMLLKEKQELVSANNQKMVSDEEVLKCKEQLTTQQKLYVKHLSEAQQLLEKLVAIRSEQVPKTVEQECINSELNIHLNSLKAKVAKQKFVTDILTQSSKSLEAYSELAKDLDQQEKDLIEELKELKQLKKKYDEVSGPEYDSILESYLNYKEQLCRLKTLYEEN